MHYFKYTVRCLLVLAISLSNVSASVASILPLDGNPNALVSGTETFSNGILNADIEYAVFGPGVFTSGAVGGVFGNPQLGGFNPAGDYVYAYHIGNSGSTPISSLQVSLASGGFFTDLGEDAFADPLGISPSVITPVVNGAMYVFNPNLLGQIEAGQSSSVLLLSSPQSYQFTTASILDSGLGATGALPTPGPETNPVPEPAAIYTWLGLAMLGGMVVLYRLQWNRPSGHSE
jgi:hypothetical protein